MLAQAGTSPRTSMEIMRHTDLRLTMNVYTDPRLLDTTSAVEQLPDLDSSIREADRAIRTGTNDDRPIVDGLGKVLTKSTVSPVFFSRFPAQNGSGEADNAIASKAPKSTEEPEYSVSSSSECPPANMPKVVVEPTPGLNRTGF